MTDMIDAAMVERVARAIARACYTDGAHRNDEGHFQSQQFQFRDQARAAIAATGLAEENARLREALERIAADSSERYREFLRSPVTSQGHDADLPDPTEEMLSSPQFEAIWQAIKSWDINVPGAYSGYCGATGNHVRAIMDAIGFNPPASQP